MARDRFIKSYSNYVKKDLHQSTSVGNIYERDWMTISDLNSYAPGSLPAYSLDGFKMVIDDSVNLKKKHHYGTWLRNDACEGSNFYWSLECLTDDTTNTIKHGLTLKPNVTSLLDFACYGSASKLVESSVTNIIANFPGELYLTDETIELNGVIYYFVDNPFGIELDGYRLNNDKLINPLRNFSSSFSDYWLINEDGGVSLNLSWSFIDLEADPCFDGSEAAIIDLGSPYGVGSTKLIFYYVYYKGEKMLFHNGAYRNGKLRPKNHKVTEFFNSLDAFQKVLLNKKTNYTAILDTPFETERGNMSFRKAYTWPKSTYGDWNIEVSNSVFHRYLHDLMCIADFYDKYYTDNIWRALTHEAIVNFDWTLQKNNSEGNLTEFDNPNPKRMQAFLQVAGRQFDDLKLYIDGIRNANAVTYNENGNNPDVFLNDALNNYGWDVKSIIPYNMNKYTSYALYPSHMDGYTTQDANYEFFRRLLLNSNAILSAKGTKRSIEMIASLFGYYSQDFLKKCYHEVNRDGNLQMLKWGELTVEERKKLLTYSFNIEEYVYVAEPKDLNINEVKNINKNKLTYDFDDSDEYQGLPITEVITPSTAYLIPWYKRNKKYDADIYFESKGGWGLSETKVLSLDGYSTTVIDYNNDFKLYDETVKNLKFVETLSELSLIQGELPKTNDIYYVYDISEQSLYNEAIITYIDEKGEQKIETPKTMSHYFILKDEENDNVLGVLKDDNSNPKLLLPEGSYRYDNGVLTIDYSSINNIEKYLDESGVPIKMYGWKNISEEELMNAVSIDAKRVYYLEGTVESKEGNNPHFGHNEYDEGETYKSFYETIFKGAKEDESFMYIDDGDIENLDNIGFTLDKQIDNVKTWYFTDIRENENTVLFGEIDMSNGSFYENNISSVGIGNFIRNTELEPINYEDSDSVDDEAAANSIINTKQLYIEFVPDVSSPMGMYDFITNGIMHYIKQIIPSTTLLKYKVPMSMLELNGYHRAYIQSVRKI